MLGIKHHLQVMQRLQDAFSAEIFEIPTLPPSIPGMRLQRALSQAIQEKGGRIYDGMLVTAAELTPEGKIIRVWSEAAARRKPHQAEQFILASGGLLGGGLTATYSNGIQEQVFDLPVTAPKDRNLWFERQFLSDQAHPIYLSGIQVDRDLRPLDENAQICVQNLLVTGSNLAGGDFLRQRAQDGVALLSGYLAGEQV